MNELYGIFKKMAYDNHFESFTKELNSAYATKETHKTMKELTKQLPNHTAHTAVLAIHKGICYSTFIHNYGEMTDDPFSKGLVLELGIFSLERALSDDFDCDKDVRIVQFDRNEAIIGDINATSAFLGNSLCLEGDKLHITMSAQIDGSRYALHHCIYDTETDTFTKLKEVKLDYKGKIYPLDDASINRITAAEGYLSNGSGMPQVTNRWSEYKGYYYTAFMLDSEPVFKPLVIRTKDFDTMEFVSIVPDCDGCDCEVASIIHTDQLYTACRKYWSSDRMIVNRYDLETGTWLDSYPIEDATSRPWFFIWRDEVYLFNTIEEAQRRYANISRVRTDRKAHNHKNAPMDTVATVFLCGQYNSFFVYEDRIFFVCTLRGCIRFGELKLKLHNSEKVNERLLELFGDI